MYSSKEKEMLDTFERMIIRQAKDSSLFCGEPTLIHFHYNRSDTDEFTVGTTLKCECGADSGLCMSVQRYIFCPTCKMVTDAYCPPQALASLVPGERIEQRFKHTIIPFTEEFCEELVRLKEEGLPPFDLSNSRSYFVV